MREFKREAGGDTQTEKERKKGKKKKTRKEKKRIFILRKGRERVRERLIK